MKGTLHGVKCLNKDYETGKCKVVDLENDRQIMKINLTDVTEADEFSICCGHAQRADATGDRKQCYGHKLLFGNLTRLEGIKLVSAKAEKVDEEVVQRPGSLEASGQAALTLLGIFFTAVIGFVAF